MSYISNVQEAVLTECCKDRIPVTLFLMNGYQIQGVITDYDGSVVVCVSGGNQQMIFKHAISTIVPTRSLRSVSVN